MALVPAMAERLGSEAALGLLYASPALGAALASATSGWTSRVTRHGLAITAAAVVWGLGIVGFGLAPMLPLAVAGLVLAGGADMVSGIFRMTMWNRTIPDSLRGRLASIELISYSSGPTLGNAEAGLAAAAIGVRQSIVAGGVLCVVAVIVTALRLPAFLRYDSRAPA
jgi:MFS family permease